MTTVVRRAEPDDYELAGRVVVTAYRALPGAHMSDGYAVELADVAGRSGTTEILVAVDAEAGIVGCVTFVPDASSPWAEMLEPDEAGIRMLGVSPAGQGRGAGWDLLTACIGRAVELGRAGVFLHSTPWMTSAHRLYDRAGFVRAPARDWLPVPDVPLLAYRLELSARGA